MTLKKVLIIGSRGLLGSNIVNEMIKDKTIDLMVANRNFDNTVGSLKSIIIDISKEGMLEECIKLYQPDYIIFSAGLTDLEYCEKNEEDVNKTNLNPIIEIINCKKHFKKLIYFSTDSVFDGNKGNYNEESLPNPQNIYSKYKRLAEIEIINNLYNFTIYRLNIVGYNYNINSGFVNWIFKKINDSDTINGFGDIRFNPIHPKQAAKILITQLDKLSGICHMGLEQSFSKYEFIKKMLYFLNINNLELILSNSENHSTINRPKNTTLKSIYCNLSSKDELFNLLLIDFNKWRQEKNYGKV